MIGEVKEPPDLIDRESQSASSTDEGEPLEVFIPIQPVAAGTAGGEGEEPDRS
jgi:hypothetical protein